MYMSQSKYDKLFFLLEQFCKSNEVKSPSILRTSRIETRKSRTERFNKLRERSGFLSKVQQISAKTAVMH